MTRIYDVDTCMEILLEKIDTYEEAANTLDKLESALFSDEGCDCCNGDEALFWKQNEDCAFVDSKGEIMVVVNDKTMRFTVKFCPNCGRKF